MNRGFRYYYKNGIKRSATATFKNKGHFGYYFYLILSILAKVTLLFAPVFALTDITFVKLVKKEGKVSPLKALTSGNTVKSYYTSFMAHLLPILILVSGVVVIAALIAILYFVASIIASLVDNGGQIIAYAMLIPGLLLLLVYILAFPLLFSATAYVIETNPGIGFGKSLMLSFKTMKAKGKATLIACNLWPRVINILILASLFGIYVLLANFIFPLSKYEMIFSIITAIILIIIYLLIAPLFELTSNVATINLFEDIFEYQNKENVVKGINIRTVKMIKIKESDVNKNLVNLFDETSSQAKPVAKKQEEKEVKAQTKEVNNQNVVKETTTDIESSENIETKLENKPEEVVENVTAENENTKEEVAVEQESVTKSKKQLKAEAKQAKLKALEEEAAAKVKAMEEKIRAEVAANLSNQEHNEIEETQTDIEINESSQEEPVKKSRKLLKAEAKQAKLEAKEAKLKAAEEARAAKLKALEEAKTAKEEDSVEQEEVQDVTENPLEETLTKDSVIEEVQTSTEETFVEQEVENVEDVIENSSEETLTKDSVIEEVQTSTEETFVEQEEVENVEDVIENPNEVNEEETKE